MPRETFLVGPSFLISFVVVVGYIEMLWWEYVVDFGIMVSLRGLIGLIWSIKRGFDLNFGCYCQITVLNWSFLANSDHNSGQN